MLPKILPILISGLLYSVHFYTIPYWDGEDNSFNIEIYDDIKHFQNLKKMTLFSNDPKVYEELKLKGIDAVPS
jgi:succinylglutamate desuccinylase